MERKGEEEIENSLRFFLCLCLLLCVSVHVVCVHVIHADIAEAVFDSRSVNVLRARSMLIRRLNTGWDCM